MFWFFAPSADARLAGAVPAWRLEEISSESQRAYHLTRPQAWTMRQIAEHLSTLLGQPVAYNHRSPGEQRATLLAEGLPPLVTDSLVGLDQVFRESVHLHKRTTVTPEQYVRGLTDFGPGRLKKLQDLDRNFPIQFGR